MEREERTWARTGSLVRLRLRFVEGKEASAGVDSSIPFRRTGLYWIHA